MNTPSTPARRRSLATAQTVKEPAAVLVSLAARTMQANTAANAAKAAYDKLRKELLVAMKAEGFRTFNATAAIDGKQVSFDATIAAGTRNVIAVGKLRKLVTDEVFVNCVSAAIGTVEAVAGKAVAAQCTEQVVGEENVSVKPCKG